MGSNLGGHKKIKIPIIKKLLFFSPTRPFLRWSDHFSPCWSKSISHFRFELWATIIHIMDTPQGVVHMFGFVVLHSQTNIQTKLNIDMKAKMSSLGRALKIYNKAHFDFRWPFWPRWVEINFWLQIRALVNYYTHNRYSTRGGSDVWFCSFTLTHKQTNKQTKLNIDMSSKVPCLCT